MIIGKKKRKESIIKINIEWMVIKTKDGKESIIKESKKYIIQMHYGC